MFQHQIFFAFEFHPKTDEQEQQPNEPAEIADGHRGAGKHGKDSCVNRMTRNAVRSALNEFVAFFQRDQAAPVCPQYQPCPNGKHEAADTQEDTAPGARCCMRNDEPIERCRQGARLDDQKVTDYEQQPVPGFAPRCVRGRSVRLVQAAPSNQTTTKIIQQTRITPRPDEYP